MKRIPPSLISSLAALLLLSLGDVGADAAELAGRLELVESNGKPSKEYRQAVIYYTPEEPIAVEPLAEPFEMVTTRKQFQPRVAAVPVGSVVSFPNGDPILHNVFSVSAKNRFDLGFYRKGETRTHTFENPGVTPVFCNVHQQMVAYVLVLETPFYTLPEGDGGFRLEGLPAGPGTLTAWHERAEPESVRVELPAAGPVELRLVMAKPRVPQHTNKFGKPYKRNPSGRRYR